MDLLWWLFRNKNIMSWEAYEHIRRPGSRDITWAFASKECEGWAKK